MGTVRGRTRKSVRPADLQSVHEGAHMTRAVTVDDTIACPLIGPGEATDRLLTVASSDYRVTSVASDKFEFTRKYRPIWATVMGIAMIPILIGVALLVFIRRTESWSATIEADHRTTQVYINGLLQASARSALIETLAGPPVTADVRRFARPASEQRGIDRIATPMSIAESVQPARRWVPLPFEVTDNSLVPHSLATDLGDLIDAVPGDAAPAMASRPSPAGATILRSHLNDESAQPGTPAVAVVLDSGERRVVSGPLVIGRAPVGTPTFAGADLIAVDDQGRSVSKTHFGIRFDEGTVVVVDLESTNGTRVTLADGRTVQVEPQRPLAIDGWCRVEFGDRWLVIEEDRTK
jgi:hypothetical protein